MTKLSVFAICFCFRVSKFQGQRLIYVSTATAGTTFSRNVSISIRCACYSLPTTTATFKRRRAADAASVPLSPFPAPTTR